MNPAFALSELDRKLNNQIRLAKVAEVDHTNARLKVAYATDGGDVISNWLSWPAENGRNYRRWKPIAVGQQVVIAAPSGKLEQACIIGELYSDTIAAPENNQDIDLIQFNNGDVISHDNATGNTLFKVKGNLTLDANAVFIKAPVTQTGGDITSDGISSQHHTHPGIKPGPASTDEPE